MYGTITAVLYRSLQISTALNIIQIFTRVQKAARPRVNSVLPDAMMRYYVRNIKTFYQLWQDNLITQTKMHCNWLHVQRPTCEPVMQHKKTSLALKYGSTYQTPPNLHSAGSTHSILTECMRSRPKHNSWHLSSKIQELCDLWTCCRWQPMEWTVNNWIQTAQPSQEGNKLFIL
jgi:hypothetical protein